MLEGSFCIMGTMSSYSGDRACFQEKCSEVIEMRYL